jgi:hypothetical protein
MEIEVVAGHWEFVIDHWSLEDVKLINCEIVFYTLNSKL